MYDGEETLPTCSLVKLQAVHLNSILHYLDFLFLFYHCIKLNISEVTYQWNMMHLHLVKAFNVILSLIWYNHK